MNNADQIAYAFIESSINYSSQTVSSPKYDCLGISPMFCYG